MNFEKHFKKIFLLFSVILSFSFFDSIFAYQIFIYRPIKEKRPLSRESKISLHGEFFGQLQFPSTFPSYNDLSGEEDRWNYGFQNQIFFTDSTSFLAQLVTHDDGHQRTKFDWHFSLRQNFSENLVLIVGHDSNHDSDHLSLHNQKPYYLNRNYIGISLPFEENSFYIEPFTWFFINTNERGHLDLSGNKLRQEFGLRIAAWFEEGISFHFQILAQTEELFSLGQAFLGDLIIRIELAPWLELSLGGGLWKDIETSRLGNQQKFYKFIWGIAIPF